MDFSKKMTEAEYQTEKLTNELRASLLASIASGRDREEATLRTYTILRGIMTYAQRHTGDANDLLANVPFFRDPPMRPTVNGRSGHVNEYDDDHLRHVKLMIDELVAHSKAAYFGKAFYFYGFLMYYRGVAEMVTTMYKAKIRHDKILDLVDQCFPAL